ncbi:MAG: hypothetical protein ACO39W_05320 [Schleiferiaceae bacterium]
MKKARIVFFGTPEFASTALLALAADARTDVAAVVTPRTRLRAAGCR